MGAALQTDPQANQISSSGSPGSNPLGRLDGVIAALWDARAWPVYKWGARVISLIAHSPVIALVRH